MTRLFKFGTKQCDIHDWENVQIKMDYDIIKELEKEGCPIIVDRTTIGLNPSGEAIVSDHSIEVQIGDHVLEHRHNQGHFSSVCLKCKRYKQKVQDRVERKSKARKLWEDKYGVIE